MSILHLKAGDHVVYSRFDTGYDSDKLMAKDNLLPHKIYKIKTICINQSSSSVTLYGLDGLEFNTVLFDPYPSNKRINTLSEPPKEITKINPSDLEALAQILESPQTVRIFRAIKVICDVMDGAK